MGAFLSRLRYLVDANILRIRWRIGAMLYGYRCPQENEDRDLGPGFSGVYRLDRWNLVKFRPNRNALQHEFEALQFLHKHCPTVPVPVPRQYMRFANLSRDGRPQGEALVMSYVEAPNLRDAAPYLSPAAEDRLFNELKTALEALRSIPHPVAPGMVSSVTGGPSPDVRLTQNDRCPAGPFESVSDFHDYLVFMSGLLDLQTKEEEKAGVWRVIEARPDAAELRAGLRDSDRTVLTHCDLRDENILVNQDGSLAAIINWELTSFLPEWYDWTRIVHQGNYERNEWWDLESLLPAWEMEMETFLHKMGMGGPTW